MGSCNLIPGSNGIDSLLAQLTDSDRRNLGRSTAQVKG
jgi:hypothetical protein